MQMKFIAFFLKIKNPNILSPEVDFYVMSVNVMPIFIQSICSREQTIIGELLHETTSR